jgi:uncharacterized protein
MALAIRDACEHDLDQLLAVNNNAGPAILPIDAARLRHLHETACYFRVAEVDGTIAGFLVALAPAADYDSPNFRWFVQRFDDFVYIDRIVIAKSMRGLGLGRVFYADVQSYAEVRSPRLCCEVFLDPRDDVSVLFHGTYGFREEGQQTVPSGQRVSLLAKELCSWPWVRDTYLQGPTGQLPNQPWLAGRPMTRKRRARAAGAV